MMQVIICQKDAYIISNKLTDFVPQKDSSFYLQRNRYVVTDNPQTFIAHNADVNLLKDATVFLRALCTKDKSYLQKLTPANLRVGNASPDVVVIVPVKMHMPSNMFDELESKQERELESE